MRPRLLDLFCGEGGAGHGYALAGFDVTGVDHRIAVGRRYPYRFVLGDALAYADRHAGEFDAVHASPPCQVHSTAPTRNQGPRYAADALFDVVRHLDLVGDTRVILTAAGRPYVIENVPRAPLAEPITLCGTMFGLGAVCADGWRSLRRHRIFECQGFDPVPPRPCDHSGPVVSVYGHGGGATPRGYAAYRDEAVAALGVPWMTRVGAAQAIPPAYTEWLGTQLLEALGQTSYVLGAAAPIRTTISSRF